MIEILEGTHETINYGNPLGLRLFHNVDYEDYPEHWHTAIEIIMPIHEGYNVIIGLFKRRRYFNYQPGCTAWIGSTANWGTYYLTIQRLLIIFVKRNGDTVKCASACAVFIRGRRHAEIIQFCKTSDGFHYCGV